MKKKKNLVRKFQESIIYTSVSLKPSVKRMQTKGAKQGKVLDKDMDWLGF